VPAKVYQLELATGKKTVWKQIVPVDPTGVSTIGPILMTPDGEDLRLWFPSNPRRSLFGGGPEVDSHSSYLARVNQAVTFFTSYQFATLNVVSSLFPQAVKA
jgi:hypothetical protein